MMTDADVPSVNDVERSAKRLRKDAEIFDNTWSKDKNKVRSFLRVASLLEQWASENRRTLETAEGETDEHGSSV